MGMKSARIELHIDELVLHGFAPGDRFRIGEAVERELTRLAAEHGLPQGAMKSGGIGRVDGGIFRADTVAKPEVIGTQVAQSVHGAIGKASMKGKG